MNERVWRAGIVAVGALAVLVRLSSPPEHFRDGELIPADADSAYHLRRVMSFFDGDGPWPMVWDPFLGFPDGAPVPWAPGWDAWTALVAWLCGGLSTETVGFQIGLASAGMIVAVATAQIAAALGRRLFGPWAGLAAGLFTAIVPMHVAATQFARLDHNPAEGFVIIALAAEAARPKPRWWAVGVVVALACFTWVGGLMYAALGMGAVCLAGLLSEKVPWSSIGGMAFGVVLLAPIATAVGVAGGTPFTYAYLSAFHPLVLAVLTAGAAWLFALKAWPARRRLVGGAGLVVLALVGAAMAPFIYDGLTQWLLTYDPWLNTVQEMQPFFSTGLGEPRTWTRFVQVLSWLAPTLPIALGLFGLRAWRRRDGSLAAVVAMSAGAFGLLILQARFGWTLAPLLGVMVAGLLVQVPRLPAWAAVVVVGLANVHSPEVMETAWVKPKARQFKHPYRFEAYFWIRENTPAVDPDEPEYGIAGNWDHGHWISGLAQRPEHIGHFGTYAGGEQRYLDTMSMYQNDPELLYAMMERDRLRYLVVEAIEVEDIEGPMRTLRDAGSGGLSRLRAVYAASPHPRFEGRPGAWVYELVDGARIVGQVDPGQDVRLRLSVRVNDEPWYWRSEPTVDAEGRFEARIPYWNGEQGALQISPKTTLFVDDEIVMRFKISEDLVRSGGVLELELPTEEAE